MGTDRFGNAHAPGLPYARGEILGSTEDDFRKLEHAWRIIERTTQARGADAVFNFSGLERGLPLAPEELAIADDEIAPALSFERFRTLALEHFGGSPDRHDAALFNRMTAATLATHLTLVKPGDTVVGVSPSHSHPSVVRAAGHVGARFVDTRGLTEFQPAIEREKVSLVVLTRLAVTYELMPLEAIREIVRSAHGQGALVYVDDAGGARVGPAIFGQPRLLDLGVDVGATGMDKYGTVGPRLGLMGGEKNLISKIRAKGFEFGLEARPFLYPAAVRSLTGYRPERVRELVASTREVAQALKVRLGDRITETPVIAQLLAEDILEIAMERASISRPTIVPFEATAALAMLLLRDFGILTVHFVGLPPGTSAILFKFMPPETVRRFGGPEAFAQAVDTCLDRLAALVKDPAEIRRLLFGAP
jgi:L-seryl-tRNA(Ser) seleniumtransferase